MTIYLYGYNYGEPGNPTPPKKKTKKKRTDNLPVQAKLRHLLAHRWCVPRSVCSAHTACQSHLAGRYPSLQNGKRNKQAAKLTSRSRRKTKGKKNKYLEKLSLIHFFLNHVPLEDGVIKFCLFFPFPTLSMKV